jgi:hypothetical protein
MKTYHNFLTFCLILIGTVVFSQEFEPQDYAQKLSYTEFETDYYLIDQKDLERVSQIDKVKLKEIKWERDFEKYINEEEERTTIIKHISNEGSLEDWMEEPQVVLIDKDGISHYSHRGEKLNRINHAPKYLELAKNTGSDLLPIYPFPGKDQIEKMKKAGLNVEELNNNFIEISFPYQDILYNENQLFVEISDKNEKGEIMHSTQRSYIQLANGEFVLERIRESRIEMFENDVKAEHVFLRIFTNYRYENSYAQFSGQEIDQSMKISLNADGSKAKVEYQPFSTKNRSELMIFNVSGHVLKSLHSDHSGTVQIDLSDLSPGVYIMRIQSDGRTLSEKFVKL